MMFSTTCAYAMRAMCRLAALRQQGYASMNDICEGTDLPSQFIAKIMRDLAKADLLISAKGRGGGFALARDPSAICLYDIVEVIDGVQQYKSCVLGLSLCDDKQPCPQHDDVKPVRQQILKYLKTTNLDVMSQALIDKQSIIQQTQRGRLTHVAATVEN
ncbi:MAG: Rrf2 family transcriptional regulator [Phycisphaeraceae bacterium]